MIEPAPAQGWKDLLRQREQSAYRRGRQDGECALREELLRHQSQAQQLQSGVLQSLAHSVPQVVRETESALMQLALDSAEKIVAGIPVSPEIVEAVVKEAIGQIESTAEITVLLHPEDLALLPQPAEQVTGQAESGPLQFAASPEVSRGGCLVRTRFGVIDARRETKVKQLRQTLDA